MSDEEQRDPTGDKVEQIAKKGRTSSISVPHRSIDKENKKQPSQKKKVKTTPSKQ